MPGNVVKEHSTDFKIEDGQCDYSESKNLVYKDCDHEMCNILYILFAPKSFTRPFAEESGGVRIIDAISFRNWLTRQRAANSDMQTIVKPLIIKK